MKKHIYFICGIPASGKDWFVENKIPASVVVSFDNIRIEEYEKKNPDHGLDSIKLYNKAWEYCNSARIDLMKPLIEKVDKCLMLGLTPCICNTLLTRKSRAAMLDKLDSEFRNVEFHAIFLIVDFKTALKRNQNRTDHVLSEDVMHRFLAGPQEYPSTAEGFDSTEVVNNA